MGCMFSPYLMLRRGSCLWVLSLALLTGCGVAPPESAAPTPSENPTPDVPPPPTPTPAEAYLDGSTAERVIEFSGFRWKVKSSETQVGPGPNWFSDRRDDVWVDDAGRLHMTLRNRDGHWWCTEVVTENAVGYGSYGFYLSSRVDLLDPNVVLGLFTWDDETYELNANCEIDIEVSRWTEPGAANLHYSVQPTSGKDDPSGRYQERFQRGYLRLEETPSTHRFDWRADEVRFLSYYGHGQPERQIDSWTYTAAGQPARSTIQHGRRTRRILIPEPGETTHLRLNLWLVDGDRDGLGNPPLNGADVEVIFDRVEYTAAP